MNRKLLHKSKKKRKQFLKAIPLTLLAYYQEAYALRMQEPSCDISPYITVNFRFELRYGWLSSLIEAKQIQGREEKEPYHFFLTCETLLLNKIDALEKSNSYFEELNISKKELIKIYQKTYHLLQKNNFQVLIVWDDYNSIWQIHARL